MKIAVISDIHGNNEALQKVLADIQRTETDKIVCLGDLCGYGPEPDLAIDTIRELNIPNVIGNHDKAIWDDKLIGSFNNNAQISIHIHRDLLSSGHLRYLRDLPKNRIEDNHLFVHACPPDDYTTYIPFLSENQLKNTFENFDQQVAFTGHSHLLNSYSLKNKHIVTKALLKGKSQLDKRLRHIINCGSVGQPRDGDHHAKYVVFDDNTFALEIRYVDYDIDKVTKKIRELELPEYNAMRLY